VAAAETTDLVFAGVDPVGAVAAAAEFQVVG
jgi:hypothetical protein